MKKHHTLLIVALAAIALAATACSKTATNSNNANTSTNTSSTSTNTTTTASTSTSASPTSVMQTSFDAVKKKDVAGFKKTVAAADLKQMEDAFSKDGKNADDVLKELMEGPENSMPDRLETRNEKIDGEKATVEYKTKDGDWKTAYLVKEGGEWKMKMGDPDENPPAKKDSGGMDDMGHK